MYQVRLDDGRRVRVGLTSPSRHAVVRLLEGDSVLVKLVPRDPSRGQITKKL
jgi:translation initiation factor IF-1